MVVGHCKKLIKTRVKVPFLLHLLNTRLAATDVKEKTEKKGNLLVILAFFPCCILSSKSD